MGKGHHHGGGYRGGFGPGPWWGGYGYPIQYGPSEVFVVDRGDDADKERALAYVMSLPKGQRAAAYTKLFGKPAPASVLGDWPPYAYQNAGGMALSWKQRNGGMSAPWTQPYEYRAADVVSLGSHDPGYLPIPGRPEILAHGQPMSDCGCGCNGTKACRGVGEYTASDAVKYAAIGVGAYLLYKMFVKRR